MTTPRKPATAAEALSENITFEHGGISYTIPPTSEWSYETLEAYEDGKIATFVRELLGAEQHLAFKATKPKVTDLSDLLISAQKALGIAGN